MIIKKIKMRIKIKLKNKNFDKITGYTMQAK